MIRRRVQRVEHVILVLHFRSVGHGKTQFAEGPHDVVRDLGQRMQPAQSPTPPRSREVDWFLGQGGLERQFLAPCREHRIQFRFHRVDLFAGRGALFLREGAQLLHQRRKLSLGSDVAALDLIQGRQIPGSREGGERLLFQRLELRQ
jgi:hypothetical protein